MFGIEMHHLHSGSAESSQRSVESRVLQEAFKDVPGVSASMIRMFMWPLQCLKGSGGELTLNLCGGSSLSASVTGLGPSQRKQAELSNENKT